MAGLSFSCADLTCGFTDRSFDNDAGGSVSSRQWDFGDGETSTEANPTHSFLVAASYTVRLTVIDNMGEAGTVSRQVTVPAPARTTPAFSVACSSLTCTFTDETTTGDVLNIWQWDFGDGSRSSEQNPVHTYAVTGPTQFTVTLTVWDSNIGGGTVSRIINVAP